MARVLPFSRKDLVQQKVKMLQANELHLRVIALHSDKREQHHLLYIRRNTQLAGAFLAARNGKKVDTYIVHSQLRSFIADAFTDAPRLNKPLLLCASFQKKEPRTQRTVYRHIHVHLLHGKGDVTEAEAADELFTFITNRMRFDKDGPPPSPGAPIVLTKQKIDQILSCAPPGMRIPKDPVERETMVRRIIELSLQRFQAGPQQYSIGL